MRHYHFLLAAIVGLGALACSDDDPRLFTETSWRVRCPAASSGCFETSPDRVIFNVDGEDGHSLQCSATRDGETYVMSFKVGNPSEGYSLSVNNARFSRTGGPLMGQAQVIVQEGANTYQGVAGAGQVSDNQQCMSETIMVGEDDNGDPQISGRVLCRGLPNVVDPGQRRDITAAGTTQQAQMDPFSYRLVNCSGL